ncbi:NlpC/P60 family protein [Cytobacillus firmus]|uniref:NlpC/P60 family protein n=2 Tax=Cytobacillus TaxID=2675230 RepID=A0A366JME0_CYTFI|nr:MULTISPECIES: C40 family peptidase [Cytobacillus]RBP88027.1 NlpC/P60 family protein [Cytobacillus firmus]TDX37759.1 NlpC/P60 family protein [Cytobacillus oceanisediminis]
MAIQQKWLVSVPAATLWTASDSSREIDFEAITNPVNLDSWLEKLTYEPRLELCDGNLVQSQVLYGEEVIILEEKDGWVHVVVPSQPSSKDGRGYPGWLPKAQLTKNEDWKLDRRMAAVIQKKKATLYSNDREPELVLSYQTILPVLKEEAEWIQVQTPEGAGYLKPEDVQVYETIEAIRKGSGKDIIDAGEQFIGLPYLWGGMSSFGYDCSGFSYSMCKANGFIIPRDAHDQAEAGYSVELDAIEPGDLLFFAYEEGKGKLHHVGIYYGDGKLLHSPNTGKTIEIIDLKDTIYEKELCAARRYWQETEE